MIKNLCACMMFAAVLAAGQCAWADDQPYVTDAGGFIPYWLGLGPIPVGSDGSHGTALDQKLAADLGAPKADDTVALDGVTYTWRQVSAKPGTPIMNLPQAGFGNTANCEAVLVSYLKLDNDQSVSIAWSSQDSASISVNGKEIGRFVGDRPCKIDANTIENVKLNKGVNVFMLKVLNTGRNWGATVRLVAEGDQPLSGAKISMTADGVDDPNARGWKEVNTGQTKPEGPLKTYLVAGQVGYATTEQKLAIATSLSNRTWGKIEIHDAATNAVVYTIPKDGGQIVPEGRYDDVAQYISRVYFSDFKTPGRYYLFNPDTNVKSFPFNIGDDVYAPLAKEVTRMFYFQRNGEDLDEKHAGKWAAKAYHDLAKAQAATVHSWPGGTWTNIGGPEIDPTPHDVHGGWYDAGDPNKYTKNEVCAHNLLLMTWDMNKQYVKDNDLNIPESGNGVPDLLDEVRWTTDYLLRIQRDDGAVYDRVAHNSKYDENGKPIENITEIAEPCSGATLCAISAWAMAASVWQEAKIDPDFSKKCLDAAVKSWKYMQDHPSPWPADADGKAKAIGSIDGNYGDENMWKANAAAALYRATGDDEYKKIAEDFIRTPPQMELGYRYLNEMVVHNYMHGKAPDAALVKSYADRMEKDVKAYRDAVLPAALLPAGEKPGPTSRPAIAYGASHTIQFHWGSNAAVALRTGIMLWWAQNFAPKEEMPLYVQAADEYAQYLTGRNPTRYCFITSSQEIGVTRAPQVMFHFANRGDWLKDNTFLTPDDAHPTRTGCWPGYLCGGPQADIYDFNFNPQKIQNDYVRMEPSIMYQSPMVMLCTFLADTGKEYRK